MPRQHGCHALVGVEVQDVLEDDTGVAETQRRLVGRSDGDVGVQAFGHDGGSFATHDARRYACRMKSGTGRGRELGAPPPMKPGRRSAMKMSATLPAGPRCRRPWRRSRSTRSSRPSGRLSPGGQGHRVRVRQVCDKEPAGADGTKPPDWGERCRSRAPMPGRSLRQPALQEGRRGGVDQGDQDASLSARRTLPVPVG